MNKATKIIFLAILLTIAYNVFALPRLSLADREFDFGRIEPLSKQIMEIELSNNGDSRLGIYRVRACCGATYNGENRPIYWSNGVTNIVMSFDRMGRRVQYLETSGATTNANNTFTYDNYLCIARHRALPDTTVETDRFIWDPTEPIATRPLVFNYSTAPPAYYTHDGNKNVSELVGDCVSAHYYYNIFGVRYQIDNVLNHVSPWSFSSEYFDSSIGLNQYNFRALEPNIARWINREPFGETLSQNLYFLVANNAAKFDVLGLTSSPDAPSCTECYLIRSMLFLGADVGGKIGRNIYNTWINGGGDISATPEDFDKYGSLRKNAFAELARKTLSSKIKYLPCGETSPKISNTEPSYPSSAVYAIRGFELNSSCSLTFSPVCKNCKCIEVRVEGMCNFEFKDEFIFRDKGSFAGGMIDEKTVKMCAEKLNWGVGTVLTTARQTGWQGETYISCPKENLPPGWLNPLTE